ncbi:MAG TPA: DEAD/DEAH box helicase family protein [Nitrososphaeraceae archaeon]|nr:DEAD/DEAH box helicase family protein [Nitrososphaeraceae archaeon]
MSISTSSSSSSSTNTVYTSAISQLKFPFSLTKDQVEGVEAWIENDFRGTILYSTGTGKTEIAFECAKRVANIIHSYSATPPSLSNPQNTITFTILMLVPRITLIEQNIKRLVSYGIPRENIGSYFGEIKQVREITVATYQSIIRNLDIIRKSDMVIFDEIHLVSDSAKVFRKIFDAVTEDNKKALLGLTATLDETDLNKYNTILTLLPPVKRYQIKKAVNDRRLAKPIVIPVKVTLTEKEQEDYDTFSSKIKKISNRFKRYDAESMTLLLRKGGFVSGMAKAWFSNVRKRKLLLSCAENKLLAAVNLITKKFPNERIMVFSETIDSINKLKDMLELYGTKSKVIDSKTSSSKRQKILDQWGKDFYPLLSVHTLEIGFDIPQVRIEIILATTSNMNQVIQRIGRVIRKHEGKDLALIYVIYISDTKDDDILQIIKKAITTTPTEEVAADSIEGKRDSLINNKMKSAEKGRIEKAYRIIESSLIEPMIIELKDYGDAISSSEKSKNNQNTLEHSNNRKLFRVRSSTKEKNRYYDVDIENKTCTCPDFSFRQTKCKHIVATELYLF